MTDAGEFAHFRAFYHTFGCKLNFAETSSIADAFAQSGVLPVQRGEVPDIIVINTCSVTEIADTKCRQYIRSLHNKYPEARILVTGCYAQLKPQVVSSLPGVSIVIGNELKSQLPDLLKGLRDSNNNTSTNVTDIDSVTWFGPACSRGDRTRWFLKVQDGCDYRCSYCTIPLARGHSRSPLIQSLVEQATKAAADGAKEIVLTGVNIGDFGKRNGEDFLSLIKQLDSVEGIERYRISSIEPNLLTDEIIAFVGQSKRFMPHFHIPLQSGDNDVLALMRRRYKREVFASRIHNIKRTMPDAFIGVDMIVGARGETQQRFQNSMDFIRDLPVSRLHVFPYSERPNTAALSLEMPVSPQEKHLRARKLIELSDSKLREFESSFVGKTLNVLTERISKDKVASGFSENYIKVSFEDQCGKANIISKVQIVGIDDEGLKGIKV